MLREIKEIHILHLEWVIAHSIFLEFFPIAVSCQLYGFLS